MPTRLNYTGKADFRVIKRADLIALGLTDPGADLIWSKANSYELNIANDIALYLIAQGEFATDDSLNFGQALSILGGSGVVLNSVRIAAQFVMPTAATAVIIPGCSNLPFVYDGRPVEFYTTPMATSKDQAASGLIQLIVAKVGVDVQAGGAREGTFYRQQESVAASINPHKVELGPLSAWVSDGVPWTIGQTYSAALWITAGSGNKASTNANTQPFTFGVRTC